jgi:hypothetical protein
VFLFRSNAAVFLFRTVVTVSAVFLFRSFGVARSASAPSATVEAEADEPATEYVVAATEKPLRWRQSRGGLAGAGVGHG